MSDKVLTPETIKGQELPPYSDGIVRDSSGNPIIDQFGLNSSHSFQYGLLEDSSSTGTTSGTYVAIGASGAGDFNLTFSVVRQVRVLFMLTIAGWDEGCTSGMSCDIQLYLDGTAIGAPMYISGTEYTQGGTYVMEQTASGITVEVVEAGTHTIEAKFRSRNMLTANPADVGEAWISATKKTLLWLTLGK